MSLLGVLGLDVYLLAELPDSLSNSRLRDPMDLG
jgi:hypothetical protein